MYKTVALIFLIFTISSASLTAQDEEEFFLDIETVDHGGFGAFVMKTGPAVGSPGMGLLLGGRGGWIINHQVSIGGGAYAQVSGNRESEYVDPVTNNNLILMFTQVGFELGIIKHSYSLVHYNFLFHIGAGNLQYIVNWDYDQQQEDYNHHPDYGSDWFFQMEPQFNIELNVTTWFRLAAGVGYRFARNADYTFEMAGFEDEKFDSNDVNGFTGSLHFKFGDF